MDVVLKIGQRIGNAFLSSKNIRLAVIGVGIAVPSLFVGAMVANNIMPPVDYNLVATAKGTTAAAISTIEVSEITDSTAVIRWKTKHAADRQVDYGISETYDFTSKLGTRPSTKHEVALVDLERTLKW